MENLPPERVAAHQAADSDVLKEAFAGWFRDGLLAEGQEKALRGLVPAVFVLVMHKDDFPEGSFKPTVRLIAEALAMRIAAPEEGAKP